MESPANAGAVVADAMNKLKSGNVAQAIAVLKQASTDYPDDAQVFTCLGVACNAKGDKPGALDAFEKALALQKSPRSHYNLGLAYEAADRTDDALRQYREALALDSGYAAAGQAVDRLTSAVPVAAQAAEPTMASQASAPVSIAPEPTLMNEPPPPPDFTRQIYERELRFAQQRRDYLKAAIIYGAGCGAGFALLVQIMLVFVQTGFVTAGAVSAGMVIGWLLKGALLGAVVGLWIGYTCGDNIQGLLAGAAVSGAYGLIAGLLAGWGKYALVSMTVYGILGAVFGLAVGTLVESSIGD